MTKQTARILNRQFVLAFFAQLALSSVSCLLIPTLPIHLSRIGSGEVEIGILIGAFSLSSLFLRPFVGGLLLKISEVTFMFAGALLFVLTSAGYLLAPPFWPLLAVRVFQGIGAALFYTAAATFAANSSPADRLGQSLSYYFLAFNIAFALAPSFGMFLINSFSVTVLFLFCTGLSLISLLIISKLEKKPIHRLENLTFKRGSFLSRKAILPSIVVFMASLIWGALTAFFPLYAIEHGMTNPGLFFGIFAIMVIAGRALGGQMLDFYRRESVVLLCLMTCIIAMSILLVFKTSLMFLVAAGIWGIGHAFIYPALAAYTLDLAAPSRGPAIATFQALDDLGVGLGSVIMGIVLRLSNYQIMFLSLAFIGLINLSYFYYFVRERGARENNT